MRHAEGPMREAIRVAQKRDRRRPVAEIQAGAFHRRVDHGQCLDPCGAQGRLYGGKLRHLAAAERAVQPAKEADQKRPAAQAVKRHHSFEIGRGERERGRGFPRLQRTSLVSHGTFLGAPHEKRFRLDRTTCPRKVQRSRWNNALMACISMEGSGRRLESPPHHSLRVPGTASRLVRTGMAESSAARRGSRQASEAAGTLAPRGWC